MDTRRYAEYRMEKGIYTVISSLKGLWCEENESVIADRAVKEFSQAYGNFTHPENLPVLCGAR